VDGFRTITQSVNASVNADPTYTLATLVTGYGPIRKTKLLQLNSEVDNRTSAALGSMLGTQLQQSKTIEPDSNDMWLTLTSAARIQPPLQKGSFLQLKDELLRFTGEKASGVGLFTLPDEVGKGCKINDKLCGADSDCASIDFDGCSEKPMVSLVFSEGKIVELRVLCRGACTAEQRARLTSSLMLRARVTCTTNPTCGNSCSLGPQDFADNVIQVQRTQFSTSATQLTCNFDAVCRDWVKSSTLYLENIGLRSLSLSEL